MSSFLLYVESLSREERSDSRFVRSGRTKALVFFLFLRGPASFLLFPSFSFFGTDRQSRLVHSFSLSLFLSLFGEELWNRVVLDRDTLSTLPVYPPILGVSIRENVLYTFIQGVQKYALKGTVT